jgi:hypothetical protein
MWYSECWTSRNVYEHIVILFLNILLIRPRSLRSQHPSAAAAPMLCIEAFGGFHVAV